MKKVNFVFCLLLFGSLVIISCASQPSPKPLNLNTITEEIPIYSLNIIVGKDLNSNNLGEKIFQKIYLEELDNTAKHLASKGIRADIQKFKEEFDSSPNIIFEEIKITSSFVLHRYYWKSQIKPETRLELSMPLIVTEDGSMILEYKVKKDDPLYEPGYLFSSSLNIAVTN